MSQTKKPLSQDDVRAYVRYFQLLLRVKKRVVAEIRANPTLIDHFEPDFRLLVEKHWLKQEAA